MRVSGAAFFLLSSLDFQPDCISPLDLLRNLFLLYFLPGRAQHPIDVPRQASHTWMSILNGFSRVI
jgi:hypothetical protein